MFPYVSIFGFDLQSYFLYLSLWTTGLVILTFYLAKRNRLNVQVALNTSAIILIFGFLGARILHILFEQVDYYLSSPKKVFYFWEGGFVFMGGLFAAFFAVIIYFRLRKHSFFIWADFFAPILALGYGGGRMACLLAGCCYGKVCLRPWKVTFVDGLPRHPTQAYAMILELLLAALLFNLRRFKFKNGSIFSIWLIGHGLGRLVMENYRDDYRGILIQGLTVSTWLSFAVILLGLSLLLIVQVRKTNIEPQ